MRIMTKMTMLRFMLGGGWVVGEYVNRWEKSRGESGKSELDRETRCGWC